MRDAIDHELPSAAGCRTTPEQQHRARLALAGICVRLGGTAGDLREVLAALGLDGKQRKRMRHVTGDIAHHVISPIQWRETDTRIAVLHLACGHTVRRITSPHQKAAICPDCTQTLRE